MQQHTMNNSVTVSGDDLNLDAVVRVARRQAPVAITSDATVRDRVAASHDYIMRAVEANEPIYGVTSGFGARANIAIDRQEAEDLQNNIPWFHQVGSGQRLAGECVRAGMLLRMNSLLRGASGIRLELIERMEQFLNLGITPHVYEFASIGASGDLAPLSYIMACLVGTGPTWKVDYRGTERRAIDVLAEVGLPPLRLRPKEGLALVNGTAVMTGTAVMNVHDARNLLALTLGAHGLMIQGLAGTNQSFHPFIHEHKPHPGQLWTAARMLDLLDGSRLVRDEMSGEHDHRGDEPIQDRYSLRCLPQFIGPVAEGLSRIARQMEIEVNSATDNPLVDHEHHRTFHGGNFLGQYIGVGMDQLRYYLGLLAKHLDAQISILVTPQFSGGLPSHLVGNAERKVNMGLQGLQIAANTIMPQLLFYGNSLADRFPTHAEQFNQNINSQGFGSANLARRAIEIYQHYIAIALMFGVQAVDLRTQSTHGHYDAGASLSPSTRDLYEAVLAVVGKERRTDRSYVWNDDEQALDQHIARIVADIRGEGRIVAAVAALGNGFEGL